jgi:hypothetical protein
MQTATPTRQRTVRLTRTSDTLALVIRQVEAGKTTVDAYFLQRIATGWAFSKHDGTRYHTSESLCTCKGHQRWKHCKHSEAVKALKQRGKL